MSRIGIHVFKNKDMVDSIRKAIEELNIKAIQIFTHGPRNFKINKLDYTSIKSVCKGINIYVHSSYPTNPWKNTPESIQSTVEQFASSFSLKSKGVVLHIPKIDPVKTAESIQVLVNELKKKKIMNGQKVILEMKAVKSDPLLSYETPEKINRLIEYLKSYNLSHVNVGICIDTAHIYAGGVQITSYKDAVIYCNKIKYPEWICLLHLNGNEYDAKKRAGDKHAIPLDSKDKIWKDTSYKNSGCRAFIEYSKKNNIDVIVEIKNHHTIEQVKTFFKNLP